MQDAINKKHILGIDALRFASAVMVMLFHFGFLLGVNANGVIGAVNQRQTSYPELYDFMYFGWVGVQTFFVISGFVIAFSGERASLFSFFASRVVRLGPGVWICAPITIAILLAVGLPVGVAEIRGLRNSMAFIPWEPWVDGVYWTLGIEIAFYSLIWLLIGFGRFMAIRYVAIFIGVISTIYWLPQSPLAAMVSAVPQRGLQLLLVQHGMFFALGVFLWLQFVKAEGRNIGWCALFLVGGCLQIAGENEHVNVAFGKRYSVLVACVIWLGSVALLVVSVRFNHLVHRAPYWFLKMLKSAGLMTFPLYLLHQIGGAAVLGALVKNGMGRWSALTLVCLGSILAAWLVASCLEPAVQRVVKTMLMRGKGRLIIPAGRPS